LTRFIARIGPARILAGAAALAYGAFSMGIESLLNGGFKLENSGTEILALIFAVSNLGQEAIKSALRAKYPIVVMDEDGIFDFRIMKTKVLWSEIEWIDPQPAGLPDRLRVMGRVQLTSYGKLRNFLIRTIRRLPRGEVAVTFGGLDKAGAQATTWIADHRPGLVSDVWKSKEQTPQPRESQGFGETYISASIFPREWLGNYLQILFAVFMVSVAAAWFPNVLANIEELGPIRAILEKVAGLPMFIGTFVLGAAITGLFVGIQFLICQKLGDGLVRITDTGFSNTRLSSQFVPWHDVESLVFHYKNDGRLIEEAIPIAIHLREGLKLAWPDPLYFRVLEFFRRLATPEIVVLGHWGTTTSVSEIVETIQRHDLPVALREVARG
jgi:hypothetical protein